MYLFIFLQLIVLFHLQKAIYDLCSVTTLRFTRISGSLKTRGLFVVRVPMQEPILALLGPETDPETRGRGFPNEVLITKKKKSRVSSDKIIDQSVDAFSPNSVKVSQIKL